MQHAISLGLHSNACSHHNCGLLQVDRLLWWLKERVCAASKMITIMLTEEYLVPIFQRYMMLILKEFHPFQVKSHFLCWKPQASLCLLDNNGHVLTASWYVWFLRVYRQDVERKVSGWGLSRHCFVWLLSCRHVYLLWLMNSNLEVSIGIFVLCSFL